MLCNRVVFTDDPSKTLSRDCKVAPVTQHYYPSFFMADVFISYSRKDKAFVQRLDEALQQHEREAWVD